ncbi:MAG: EFR1 family ferrodoxin [Clostridia bacterium]|nr:EFR1 family ferrodoxin [Clostridia bacterium]
MDYSFLKIKFMSGTGNSYRAAVWMKEAAQGKGISSELEQITGHHNKTAAGKKPGTLMGFVFPTYGLTAPWLVIRHALQLPRVKGQHAFVVATKGALMFDSVPFRGFEGSAAYLIALILMLKGCRIRGVMGLNMPANMINVHPGLTEADSRIIIDQARIKEDFFIDRILSGRKEFWGIPDLLLGLALLPVSFIYMVFVRFFLAKLFFASENCTGCGLCAKSCPKKAIKMIGWKKLRPYWKLTCEGCMRCMGYCPNQAIEASHLFAVFLYLIITMPIFSYILDGLSDILKVDMSYSFAKTIFYYLYYLFSISFAYYIFSYFIRIPMLNKLFTYTTFTYFYRRYHEPDTELKDIAGKVRQELFYNRKNKK